MDVNDNVRDALVEAQERMNGAVAAVQRELLNIRTGRANIAVLDDIQVDYYGTQTPLNQLGSLSAPDAQLLVVQPYDKGAISAIEKAILLADLGLNPSNDGQVIRLPVPELTEERRHEMAKQVNVVAEHAKTAVRLSRREANEVVKKLEVEKEISEDDERRAHDQVQELTDTFCAKIDEMAESKRVELLKI
jgi:ribosome recycling factor